MFATIIHCDSVINDLCDNKINSVIIRSIIHNRCGYQNEFQNSHERIAERPVAIDVGVPPVITMPAWPHFD